MHHIDPREVTVREVYGYLIHGIAPRPIAWVATQSENGVLNLAPFSFFNAFGANPPIIGFSPTCRLRDGSFKDTFHNLMRTKECTVQIVTYALCEQMNLSSAEFDPDVDEFLKSGLTPLASDVVAPPRVQESPFQMECKLIQMIPLGDRPGSGNLALCEVVRFHIEESLFHANQSQMDPTQVDQVGRNGGSYYTRSQGNALFALERPAGNQMIGYEGLPNWVRESEQLLAKHLCQLASIAERPSPKSVKDFHENLQLNHLSTDWSQSAPDDIWFEKIQQALEIKDIQTAWHWIMLRDTLEK